MSRIICTLLAWCLLPGLVWADDNSADTSLQLGIANIRAKKFEEASKLLETAFNSAKNDRTKMRAAEGLLVAYRETRNVDKYLDSADFVISNSERKAGRSVAATQLCGFLHFNGKTDDAIKRYEKMLQANAEDIPALNALTQLYQRSDRENKTRAKELEQKLSVLNKKIAAGHAKRLETEATAKADTAAWNLKDAAQFWLEAEDSAAALTAAKSSTAAAPEKRSPILTYQWHEGLGDIFQQTGEPTLAVKEFEAAVKSAPEGILKTNVQKKLDQAKEKVK